MLNVFRVRRGARLVRLPSSDVLAALETSKRSCYRDASNDSRNPVFGMVPLEDVVGPVSLVWMNAQFEFVFETP